MMRLLEFPKWSLLKGSIKPLSIIYLSILSVYLHINYSHINILHYFLSRLLCLSNTPAFLNNAVCLCVARGLSVQQI